MGVISRIAGVCLSGVMVACGSTSAGTEAGGGSTSGGASGGGAGGPSSAGGSAGEAAPSSGGAGGPSGAAGAIGGTDGAGGGASVAAAFFLTDLPEVVPTDADVDTEGNIYLVGIASRPHVTFGDGSTLDLVQSRFTLAVAWSLDPRGMVRWAVPVDIPAPPSDSWQEPTAQLSWTPNGKVAVVVSGTSHFYVATLGAQGAVEYVRDIPGSIASEHLFTTSDAYYLVGGFQGNVDLGCGQLVVDPTVASGGAFFARLSSADGSCSKSDSYQIGPTIENVHETADGLLIVGEFSYQASIGGKTLNHDGPETVAWAGAFSTDFTAKWLTPFDATRATGIALDASGIVLSGAIFPGSTDLNLPYDGTQTDMAFVARIGADGALGNALRLPGGAPLLSGFRDGAGVILTSGLTGFYDVASIDAALAQQAIGEIAYTDAVNPEALLVGKDGAAVLVGAFTGNVHAGSVTITNRTQAENAMAHGFVLSLPRTK